MCKAFVLSLRYQFEPNKASVRVAIQILLKTLVNMPKADFSLLKSVVPSNMVRALVISLDSIHGNSVVFTSVSPKGGGGHSTPFLPCSCSTG